MSQESTQEGRVDFPAASIDKPCHTYYKIFGDLRSGNPPLIILHGGPGSGHEYILPFRKLWPLYGIPVVFYDQIGCAGSTRFPEKLGDETFWRVDLFVAELENLLNHLQINRADGPGYHVLGHSWGGKVAATFAAAQPRGLRRLILVGAPASGQLFFDGLLQLKKQLSTETQRALDEAVQKRDFTTPAYLAAMDEFSRTFMCRAHHWPEEFAMRNKHQAEDGTVRESLIGQSPWLYDGILRNSNLIPLLPHITAPTLVMNGEFDTTQDGPTAPFFEHIPRVRWVTLANASHMLHLDSPEMLEKVLKLVGSFLQQR